jgi:hypothetical protein
MATTNSDPLGLTSIYQRINEIEAEFNSLDHWHGPRHELVKLWERLLAERADLQAKISEGR